jgi:hypothetical protein
VSPTKISYWLIHQLDVRREAESQVETKPKPEQPKREQEKTG